MNMKPQIHWLCEWIKQIRLWLTLAHAARPRAAAGHVIAEIASMTSTEVMIEAFRCAVAHLLSDLTWLASLQSSKMPWPRVSDRSRTPTAAAF